MAAIVRKYPSRRGFLRCTFLELSAIAGYFRLHRPADKPAGVGAIPFSEGTRLPQNFLGKPACLSTALAVWRDFILPSTTNLRPVMGLYQISWSPLP